MSITSPLRSVFISDLHLGYKGADIRSLNAFLMAHEFRHLYLVGDILDGWKLEQRWYWTQDYSDFLDILIALRNRGVRMTLLTGNHDEKLRSSLACRLRPLLQNRFSFRLEERVIHRTVDGRSIIVMHGDQLDSWLLKGVSRHADIIWAKLGEIIVTRSTVNSEERPFPTRWSLGKAIATNAKALLWSFTENAMRYARQEGADGIICGHSHVAALSEDSLCVFANCGSWTGARGAQGFHTAVVEDQKGRLKLVNWPSLRRAVSDPNSRTLHPDQPNTRTVEASQMARLIYRFWAPAKIDNTAGCELQPHVQSEFSNSKH